MITWERKEGGICESAEQYDHAESQNRKVKCEKRRIEKEEPRKIGRTGPPALTWHLKLLTFLKCSFELTEPKQLEPKGLSQNGYGTLT